MPKKIKKFKNTDEYFRDYRYITNSHLQTFEFCPFLYISKRHGKVTELEKDYFVYGSAVDAILSGEDVNDKFIVGTKPKGSVEELRECLKVVEDEIAKREGEGKKALKTQLTKIDKFNEQIATAQGAEGKTPISSTVLAHCFDTAKEIKSQPLYKAFDGCDPQMAIGIEIDGTKVKGMFDKTDLKNGILNDDKTTKSLSTFDPEMYLQQLAWYRKIIRIAFNVEVDCYLSVGDKATEIKKSSLYYITPERLNYQEAVNSALLKEFLIAQKNNDYPPCVEKDPSMREEKCFRCDFYTECPYSRQKEFIIV